MANFYAVHVMAGKESKARDALLARAVAHNMWKNAIVDILIPTEKEYATKRGKRVIVDKKVFPGYIFVKMMLDDDSERVVKNTEGIINFVRVGGKPVPMPDYEIEAILKKLEHHDEVIPKSQFKPNEIISIISGPFEGYSGKIESVDETKGKIKAYVHVFGRDTLSEFEIKDVQVMV